MSETTHVPAKIAQPIHERRRTKWMIAQSLATNGVWNGRACAFAMAVMCNFSPSGYEAAMGSHNDVHVTTAALEQCSACESLRTEILQRYNLLIASRQIHANGLGVSIADILIRYIPNGMTFDGAESFLSMSGFKVQRRPGPNMTGDRPDRYDVYCESVNMITSGYGLISGVKVVVLLRPPSPLDYSHVQSSIAFIAIVSL